MHRLLPGFNQSVDDAIIALGDINKNANNVARTALVVHEVSEFGTGTVKLLAAKLPGINICFGQAGVPAPKRG